MPWLTLWVDPVPFTMHRGVTIYHTYNGVDAMSGFHRFRFTTHSSDADERYYFDVRELPLPGTARLAGADPGTEHDVIRAIIHEAIERGMLGRQCRPASPVRD